MIAVANAAMFMPDAKSHNHPIHIRSDARLRTAAETFWFPYVRDDLALLYRLREEMNGRRLYVAGTKYPTTWRLERFCGVEVHRKEKVEPWDVPALRKHVKTSGIDRKRFRNKRLYAEAADDSPAMVFEYVRGIGYVLLKQETAARLRKKPTARTPEGP